MQSPHFQIILHRSTEKGLIMSHWTSCIHYVRHHMAWLMYFQLKIAKVLSVRLAMFFFYALSRLLTIHKCIRICCLNIFLIHLLCLSFMCFQSLTDMNMHVAEAHNSGGTSLITVDLSSGMLIQRYGAFEYFAMCNYLTSGILFSIYWSENL